MSEDLPLSYAEFNTTSKDDKRCLYFGENVTNFTFSVSGSGYRRLFINALVGYTFLFNTKAVFSGSYVIMEEGQSYDY